MTLIAATRRYAMLTQLTDLQDIMSNEQVRSPHNLRATSAQSPPSSAFAPFAPRTEPLSSTAPLLTTAVGGRAGGASTAAAAAAAAAAVASGVACGAHAVRSAACSADMVEA